MTGFLRPHWTPLTVVRWMLTDHDDATANRIQGAVWAGLFLTLFVITGVRS